MPQKVTAPVIAPQFSATPRNVLVADFVPSALTTPFASARVFAADGVATGGGGGAGTFPPEGHVRTGEAYGPTGAEYHGNETLPTVSQVLLGVTFGAGGTEYTGTAEAGGSTKHRVRSVM